MGAEQRADALGEIRWQASLRPGLGREAAEIQLRLIDGNVVLWTLMQPAHGAAGGFDRHLIAILCATNAQAHVVATQPAIRRLVVDIEQGRRRNVLVRQGM